MAGQLLKRGDHWLARVFAGRDVTGKRIYVSRPVHGTKKQAEAALTDLLNQRNKGHVHARSKLTIDAYLGRVAEDDSRPDRQTAHPGRLRNTLKLYVRPYLGALTLDKVSPADVRAMLAALREKGLSPRSVRKAHGVTRNALEQAVNRPGKSGDSVS